jgi:hypothetical protein
MTLSTSGEVAGATQQPHLAAAEETALASQRVNGLYNEDAVESIPSSDQKGWSAIVAEWRFVAAILAPFGLAIALYFIPATKGELDNVRADAASHLELVKANTSGQFQAVSVRIDALQNTLSDTKTDVKEMRGDLKEILKRLPDPRQYDLHQIVAATPAAKDRQDDPPSLPIVRKSVKKPKPVAVKPASGFRLW